jgi:uncharacterized protein YdaU (DUF1376 family)
MHYYQFSIGDYRAATAHLSNEEDLAYRRLLDMYYDTENKIPLDTQWVSKRLRVATQVVDDVLQDMFVKHEDGWFHARCDDVIQQYHAMAEKNRANGRLGGRKKNPVGNQVETHSEPIAKATNNYKPITINQEPITKVKPSQPYQALFDVFWGKYPKKIGKDAAFKAFQKRKPDQHLLVQMLNALGEQSRSEAWVKDGGQFIPNPATWLNQGRWQDEVTSFKPVDLIHQTTPTPPNQDFALRQMDEDLKKAVPIPANIREKMAAILGDKR